MRLTNQERGKVGEDPRRLLRLEEKGHPMVTPTIAGGENVGLPLIIHMDRMRCKDVTKEFRLEAVRMSRKSEAMILPRSGFYFFFFCERCLHFGHL